MFTTQHATKIMALLRRKVLSLPAPTATGIVRYLPSSYWIMYDGTFASPNFQVGDPPYTETGGEIQIGADGLPVVQRMETLRFSFAVPRATPPAAGWPVVIADTGTGSNYHSYYDVNLVDIMADLGLAVISIDPVLSGDRATRPPTRISPSTTSTTRNPRATTRSRAPRTTSPSSACFRVFPSRRRPPPAIPAARSPSTRRTSSSSVTRKGG